MKTQEQALRYSKTILNTKDTKGRNHSIRRHAVYCGLLFLKTRVEVM
jgi:hypothetical protein